MTKPQVRLDPASLGSVEKLRGPLEAQVTSALHQAVDRVEDDYQGESVDQVATELVEETKSGLHADIAEAITPNEQQMRSVAEGIVADNA